MSGKLLPLHHERFKEKACDGACDIFRDLQRGTCTGDAAEDMRILQEIDKQTKEREKPSTKITNANVELVAALGKGVGK